jgi:hypothetical protein
MSRCEVSIHLERDEPVYRPGEPIRGEVEVRVQEACRTEMLVLSHFWRTHGRGNRDEGTPTIQSLYSGEWSAGETYRYPFEIALPNGPRTYHGNLLNVDWYIAARARLAWAIDPKAETEVILETGAAGDYCFGPRYKPPEEALAASGRGRGCILFFGVVLAALGVFVAMIELALWRTNQLSGSPWVGMTVSAGFVAVGVAVFLATAWRSVSERKLGVPEVKLRPEVAHAGATLGIGVKFCPRSVVTLEEVRAELVGLEEVVSGSGRRRTTPKHEIHRRRVVLLEPGRAIEAGEVVSLEKEIVLPASAPLTFAAPNNELKWSVEIAIGVTRWADWRRSFPITLAPAPAPGP